MNTHLVVQDQRLRDCTDVRLGAPSDGQLLAYDAETGKWKPQTLVIPDPPAPPSVLNDLDDVETEPQSGDLLQWNAYQEKWQTVSNTNWYERWLGQGYQLAVSYNRGSLTCYETGNGGFSMGTAQYYARLSVDGASNWAPSVQATTLSQAGVSTALYLRDADVLIKHEYPSGGRTMKIQMDTIGGVFDIQAEGMPSWANPTGISLSMGGVRLNGNGFGLNVAPIAKPTVSGSRGGNAALASLLTALAQYGLITDSTT